MDLNALDFEIALVSSSRSTDRNEDGKVNAADDVVFGTVDVKLQIPTLVTFAAEETVSAKYVNGVATTANIVNALTIVDKFGNNVYNPYATTLNDLFKGYNATLYNGKVQDVELASDNFFNVYDMAVEAADLEDVKVYLNNTEIAQSQVKFTYTPATGEIVLSEENANLTGDVKFEVPVTLTYMYDNYGKLAQEATAVVVFSQNAEAGEGTEVSFPTPDGFQYSFFVADYGTDRVIDFGVTANSTLYLADDYDAMMTGVPSEYLDPALVGKWQANEKYENYVVTPTDATSGQIRFSVTRKDWTGEEMTTNYLIEYSNLTDNSVMLYSPAQFRDADGNWVENGIGLCKYDEKYNTYPIEATLCTSPVEVVYIEQGGIAM